MQAQHDDRRGHLRPGVAGGDERVGFAAGLQLQADDHRAVGFTADGGTGLVVHPDDVGRLDDLDAVAMLLREVAVLAAGLLGELRFYRRGWTDELDGMSRIELGEGQERTGHRRLGREVPAHGVQRDARQLTLPWLLPAACHRNSRTPRTHGAGASSPGIADTSGSRSRAPSCACCERASFALRYVFSERPYEFREY